MPIPDRRTLLTEMRLEQAQADEVRRILSASAREVQTKLNKLGPEGNPLTRMQLQSQKASLNAMIDRSYADIGKAVREGQVAAAKAASAVVSQYENELLKLVADPAAMRRIAAGEAARTVNNLDAAMKRMSGQSYVPLSKQVYNTSKLSKGWIDSKINQALASGWDAKRLAKEVAGSINPNVRGGVSYAANRLARTEINNAYHAASWDRFNRSVIVEEVEWLLSSSHPEDDICNDYATQSPFKKNAVPAKPHPHCYCYIVPRLPTDEEFIDKLFAGEYGDEPWVNELSTPRLASAASAPRKAAAPKTAAPKTAKAPEVRPMQKAAQDAPKLSRIYELEDPEDIAEAFGRVYGGKDFNGFKVIVDTADYAEDGVGVQMRIMKDGKDAGFATRIFKDDGSVFHDFLELDRAYRGQGFSTAFSEFSEAYYKANGVRRVELHAALDDGGYVWAKAGYTWDTNYYKTNPFSPTPSPVVDQIDRLINYNGPGSGGGMSEMTEDQMRILRDWRERLSQPDSSKWPSPADMANVKTDPTRGRTDTLATGKTGTLGETVLRGVDWFGVKFL